MYVCVRVCIDLFVCLHVCVCCVYLIVVLRVMCCVPDVFVCVCACVRVSAADLYGHANSLSQFVGFSMSSHLFYIVLGTHIRSNARTHARTQTHARAHTPEYTHIVFPHQPNTHASCMP